MKQGFEIERKFIIKKPDISLLEKMSDKIINITQAYIGQNSDGFNCRVRKSKQNGQTQFFYTEKKNVNKITRIENECLIDETTFNMLFEKRLENRNVIEKTRYVVNKNGFCYEIDIFPFWQNQAFMEVELEDESVNIPPLENIEILEDVTFKKGYSNFALSNKIPDEIV